MKINVDLDITSLSIEEKISLVESIFVSDDTVRARFLRTASKEDDEISDSELEAIIDRDFDRYDEVFRALA